MADATVTVSVVPDGSATQDIDQIVTDLLAQSMDAVVADPGNDLVVSADITHSVAADTDGSTTVAAIDAAIAAVGDISKVGTEIIEADPTLDSPADVAIDISDGSTATIRWTATLLPAGATIKSITVVSTELDNVNVPVEIVGDPQGHPSQFLSGNVVKAVIGPAPSGAEVGSPHNISLAVTDSNGRTSTADVVAVTVTA